MVEEAGNQGTVVKNLSFLMGKCSKMETCVVGKSLQVGAGV